MSYTLVFRQYFLYNIHIMLFTLRRFFTTYETFVARPLTFVWAEGTASREWQIIPLCDVVGRHIKEKYVKSEIKSELELNKRKCPKDDFFENVGLTHKSLKFCGFFRPLSYFEICLDFLVYYFSKINRTWCKHVL